MTMDDRARRAAFISSYRQHRRGWARSNNHDSVNSTTSSLWSNNVGSLASDPSAEELCAGIPDVNVTHELPEARDHCLASSSSFMSSSFLSNDRMTSSHDNGPSSDISTPESHPTTFPLQLPRPQPQLTVRKSSDDDELEALPPRTERTKKKQSSRRSTPKHSNNNSSSGVTCYSSAYPSSMTSSADPSYPSSDFESDIEKGGSLKWTWGEGEDVNTKMQQKSENENKRTIQAQRGSNPNVQPCHVQEGCCDSLKDNKPSKCFTGIEGSKVVQINVAGKLFHVDLNSLNEYPNTLLGNPNKRRHFYDKDRKEYFLDRHRDTFQVILEFYKNGGVLQRPDEIPIDIFLNEVKFYAFDHDTLEEFLREEGILHVEVEKEEPRGRVRKFIWKLFEEHDGSLLSKIVTVLSAIVIALSVIVFCLETTSGFKDMSSDFDELLSLSLKNCQVLVENLTEFPPTAAEFSSESSVANKIVLQNYTANQPSILLSMEDALRNTLAHCENSVFKLQYKYAFVRCLLDFQDEENEGVSRIEEIFNKVNMNKTFESSSSVVAPRTTPKFDHMLQPKVQVEPSTFINSLLTQKQNHSENIRDVFAFTYDACSILDEGSTRTPYEWLVVEAAMGGPAGILFITESVCILWFVTELTLRFASSPNKVKFCKSFLNFIDFIAILPYFVTFIVTTIETKTRVRPTTATILRTIRLVRMLRILKLSRYSRGFRILGLTLLRSTRVLFLLVCFQMVLAVLFSSIAFFVEDGEKNSKFKSIPETFWWALITMTTVGYGDVYPTTIWGKITGACCAIMGILCISFPVPVVVSNFNYLYHLDKEKFKLSPQDLMREEEEEEEEEVEEEEEKENCDRFQDELYQEMRRSASGLANDSNSHRNPAELWNIARKSYRKVSLANIDARLEKSPSRSSNMAQNKSGNPSNNKTKDHRGTYV